MEENLSVKKPLVIEFVDEAQAYIKTEAANNATTNEEVVRKMLNTFIAINKPEIDIFLHNRETGETNLVQITFGNETC